jgi:hypothetical protein
MLSTDSKVKEPTQFRSA